MWRDPDTGKEEQETFRTKDEAELWKRMLDANDGNLKQAITVYDNAQAEGITMNALLLEHIGQLTGVEPYQIKRYKTAVRNHFSDDFGYLKVGRVAHADVVRWIKYMQAKPGRGDKPMSAKTIANHHGFLSAAFNTAIRLGYRDDNPCKGVRLPKSQATKDHMVLIDRPLWAKLIAATPKHYKPFFQFMVGTGLRFGEATALTPADFDLDAPTPTVRVSKAWKEDESGGRYIGPPKTPRSRRTVSLAPSTVDAVRPLVAAAGDGLVFTALGGGQLLSSNAHKVWGPVTVAAGISRAHRPTLHDLRHTHASWMIAAGMEIFALSRRLGHESITTTMDRYSHLLPDAHFVGASIAQKALEG